MKGLLRSVQCLAVIMTTHAAEPVVETSTTNPDDIASELEERDRRSGPWSFPVLEEWSKTRKRIEAEAGLSWSTSYHSVALGAALGDGVPIGTSGDFTFQGIWKIGQRWVDNPTELRFRIRHRHAYAHTAPSQLGPEIGALWGVVDGFSNSGLETPDLFLRHVFEKPDLEIRYGQLSIDSQFGGHQLASSKKFFLNQAFASDPAVAFPRYGAGLTAFLSLENGLSIGLGSTTVQGTQTGDQVDLAIGSGDFFHALQFGYDFKKEDDLARHLHLLVWHSDPVEDAHRPAGYGFSLTYEQEVDDQDAKAFARFSWSDGGASSLDYLLVAGYARPHRDDDLMGIAAGIGRSSGSDKDIQASIEAFYRWQVNENTQVSPDVQLLVGEGFTGSPGVRLIAGVRVGVTF